MPDARHERLFDDVGGRLHYRIAVELEPRGLYDRIVVRRGIARALRQDAREPRRGVQPIP